jgi:hypothetical protein
VNLPWLTYGCDFGANAWQPEGGVGRADRRARLDEIFARLAAGGLRTVRWFVFCDGRCGIEYERKGQPLGLDRFFRRDFETALAAASRHGLSLIPVLFDFTWFRRARRIDRVVLGGRRRLLARSSTRRLVLERVVGPLVLSYGREPSIRRWDIFNEPEWATLGMGSINPLTAVAPAAMRAVLRELAGVVRRDARQGVTVGLASPRGMSLLNGVPLDERQVHWYDRRAAQLYAPASSTIPTLLGEFPTTGSRHSAADLVAAARTLGYSGALGWSATAADAYTDLAALEAAL